MTYLDFVRTLPCSICETTVGIVAHHIKGIGHFSGTGMKSPDELSMPLCGTCHNDFHFNGDPILKERQLLWVVRTINLATKLGFSIKQKK